MENNIRHYAAAGFHFRVMSDYPISENTFHSKFKLFEVPESEFVDISIFHHFSKFDFGLFDKMSKVFSFDYLDVYVGGDKFYYVQKKSQLYEVRHDAVAVFNSTHSEGHIFLTSVTRKEYSNVQFDSLLGFGADHYLFSRILIPHKGIMLHSNALACNGNGIILTGRSGKGKSTLTGMLKAKGFSVIGEDRAIIKKNIHYDIYGSWCHGSVPDVSNQVVPLKHVFLLEHSKQNEILLSESPDGILKYILQCIVKPFADDGLWQILLTTIEEFILEVNFYLVKFNLDGNICKMIEDICENDR